MSCRSSRDSVGSCDSAVQTVSRCLSHAKDGEKNSGEVEEAQVALKKIKVEREQQRRETRSLRRENEVLRARAEEAELEVGRREQGPQAAKEEVTVKLLAENERLKAKLQDTTKQGCSQLPASIAQHHEKSDFQSYPRTYLEESKEAKVKQNDFIERGTHCRPTPNTAGVSPLTEKQATVLLESKEKDTDPFLRLLGCYLQGDNGLMSGAASAARLRRSRNCNTGSSLHEEREAMQSAGIAAQRRRTLSRSRSNSQSSQSSIIRQGSQDNVSLNNLVDALGNTEGKSSEFTERIITVLSAANRPVEVHWLQVMLRRNQTETEFWLHCTVVGNLVRVLQSASRSACADDRPYLLKSSCSFVDMMNRQQPATRHRHSYTN